MQKTRLKWDWYAEMQTVTNLLFLVKLAEDLPGVSGSAEPGYALSLQAVQTV